MDIRGGGEPEVCPECEGSKGGGQFLGCGHPFHSEGEGPENDDWIHKAYESQAGPNLHGKDRPVNPYDVKTAATQQSIFRDRRNR